MTTTAQTVRLTRAAAEAASERKATDVIAFDVSDQLAIADVFLLCSASNERQVDAVVDAVEECLRTLGNKPVRREGERDSRWVVLDYLDLVVHVMHGEERAYYALERLWKDCPVIQVPTDAAGETSDGQVGS